MDLLQYHEINLWMEGESNCVQRNSTEVAALSVSSMQKLALSFPHTLTSKAISGKSYSNCLEATCLCRHQYGALCAHFKWVLQSLSVSWQSGLGAWMATPPPPSTFVQNTLTRNHSGINRPHINMHSDTHTVETLSGSEWQLSLTTFPRLSGILSPSRQVRWYCWFQRRQKYWFLLWSQIFLLPDVNCNTEAGIIEQAGRERAKISC